MATGQTVGYVRVSSVDQNLARQLDGIKLDRVFEDKASGKDAKRLALLALQAFVREGDTVMVHSIDRLARNLVDLRAIVSGLNEKGVTVGKLGDIHLLAELVAGRTAALGISHLKFLKAASAAKLSSMKIRNCDNPCNLVAPKVVSSRIQRLAMKGRP